MIQKQLAAVAALAFFCLQTSLCFAQNSVRGSVVDSKKKPLEAASVLLLAASDSSLVRGELSGPDGGFSFENVAAGQFFVQISMIGFEPFSTEKMDFGSEKGSKNLDQIALLENAASTAEAVITVKKPFFEQKIDRISINVGASGTNAGANALQVLQRSPGLLVNRQTGIQMAGKNGVIIQINGKISRMPPDAIMAMLEGTSSATIERIELIHTPPANFDAEGSAGIINIVLKQSADEGLNGGYSVNAGYGKREKAGASAYFNFRKGKANFFGSHSYQFDHNPQVFTNYRGIQNGGGDFLETDGRSVRAPDLGIHNGRVGADFQLSKKTVVGAVGTFFNRFWDMTALNSIDLRRNGALDSRISMATSEVNRWRSATANLNFSHQFSASKSLTADVDYVFYHIRNPSNYGIQFLSKTGETTASEKLRVEKETPIKIAVGKIDWAQNVGKNGKFETGAKFAASRFDNDVRVEKEAQNGWQTDSLLTSDFRLFEDVAAGYASFSFKIDSKTDGKAGLRYEHTATNLGSEEQPNVVDRRYGSWFPTVYLSRVFDEKRSANVSYSRRIGRPGFTQLAPYLIFYDPNLVQTGNPSLQPAFIDALRVSYVWKTLNWVAEWNLEKPSIRDVPIIDAATNSQVSLPVNIGRTHTFFSYVSFPLQPTKWWSWQNSVYAVFPQFSYDYEGKTGRIPSQFVGVQSSMSFTLPQKMTVDLSGFFVTNNFYGLTEYRRNGTFSASIRKKLSEKWGELTLAANDIFQSSNFIGTTDQPDLGLKVESGFLQAERVFMLTWSNKFGNQKLRESRQRGRGAEEEMRRL